MHTRKRVYPHLDGHRTHIWKVPLLHPGLVGIYLPLIVGLPLLREASQPDELPEHSFLGNWPTAFATCAARDTKVSQGKG
jgi:hypothetical protein